MNDFCRVDRNALQKATIRLSSRLAVFLPAIEVLNRRKGCKRWLSKGEKFDYLNTTSTFGVAHMSLLPAKRAVLENLLLSDRPARPAQIAKDIGSQLNSTMMHLIWLVRTGYAVSPEKGLYAITDKGKRALGIPEITSEIAQNILAESYKEKAFHFYADIEKPLNLYAFGIRDFVEKIPKVNAQSLEFHLSRGDFEKWFECIGDVELTKKLAILKERKLPGEQLREILQQILSSRCTELSRLL